MSISAFLLPVSLVVGIGTVGLVLDVAGNQIRMPGKSKKWCQAVGRTCQAISALWLALAMYRVKANLFTTSVAIVLASGLIITNLFGPGLPRGEAEAGQQNLDARTVISMISHRLAQLSYICLTLLYILPNISPLLGMMAFGTIGILSAFT